ncbi:UNKNOWN [Stylonychia lemnae]|uniref:Uncharacterized protein n=1 Tax=Stylonychia lemnae TaxID=5949 RepID=A0A078AHV4_STYLE|nr:UNKNOWN [Stylonychia lemnae]|eukprot:CDW81087.1 UNKNOWN [Stylonychia lemnae]
MKHEWDYVQGGKTSVKIHNAPGGNSQISFGSEPTSYGNQGNSYGNQGNQYSKNQRQYQDQVNNYQSSYQKNAYDGYYGQVPTENLATAGAPTRTLDHKHHTKGQVNQYDNYSPQKSHGDERSSVKIHNPPGGKSNFSIGTQFQDEYQKPAFRQQDMNTRGYQEQPSKGRGRVGNDQFQSSSDIFGTSNNNQSKYGGQSQGFGGQKNKNQDRFGGGYQQQDYDYNNDYQGFGGRQQKSNQYQQQSSNDQLFGQRVESGQNCGPTTEKSSVKLHAPPGGKSSIQFF